MNNRKKTVLKAVKKWQKNNRIKYLNYQKWYSKNIRRTKKIGSLDSKVLYETKDKVKFQEIVHRQAQKIRKTKGDNNNKDIVIDEIT